jgi:hypothetical protein
LYLTRNSPSERRHPHPDQQGGRKLITDVAVGKADFMDGIAAVLGRGNKTVGAR